jgi:hypothetical protein
MLNGPDTNLVVGVSSKQDLAIGRPGERDTLRGQRLLTDINEFRVEFVNKVLGFQVPDLDARFSSSAQPVAVRREAESIDDRASFQRVKMLAVVQVPEHGDTVLASGSAERTVGRDGNSVDVSSVAVVVGLELALGEIPDLRNQ